MKKKHASLNKWKNQNAWKPIANLWRYPSSNALEYVSFIVIITHNNAKKLQFLLWEASDI